MLHAFSAFLTYFLSWVYWFWPSLLLLMRFCSTCPFRARTLRNLASWFSAFSRSSRSFSCSDACCCCCRWSCSFRNRSRCSCGESSGHNPSETHFQTSLSFRTMCLQFSSMLIMDKTVLIWSHDKYDDNCIHCATLCSRFIQMTLNAQLAHLVCKQWHHFTDDLVKRWCSFPYSLGHHSFTLYGYHYIVQCQVPLWPGAVVVRWSVVVAVTPSLATRWGWCPYEGPPSKKISFCYFI